MEQKRYWLRWGIVFLSLYICIALYLLTIKGGHPPAIILALIPAWPLFYLVMILVGNVSDLFANFILVMCGIVSAIEFFALGAMLGWVHQKCKDSNKISRGSNFIKVSLGIVIIILALLILRLF